MGFRVLKFLVLSLFVSWIVLASSFYLFRYYLTTPRKSFAILPRTRTRFVPGFKPKKQSTYTELRVSKSPSDPQSPISLSWKRSKSAVVVDRSPRIEVKPIPLYFEKRRSEVEPEVLAAKKTLEEENEDVAEFGRSVECNVLFTTWNDIYNPWLNSENPGAVGDMNQAADLVFTLKHLGCNVDVGKVMAKVNATDVEKYDLIITGYLGIYEFAEKVGRVPALRARTFVLDIYGTTEEFTADLGKDKLPYCCTEMPVSHFLTMYPNFAPNNTFLGLIIPENLVCRKKVEKKEFFGLVWAKSLAQIDQKFLRSISELANLTLTVKEHIFMTNVKNAGLLNAQEFVELLHNASFLVATGKHLLGLAPIQALNCNTMYLQPRYSRSYVERNELIRGKPTSFYPTSPLPFLEEIGPPSVHTIDYEDRASLRDAINSIRVGSSTGYDTQHVREFSAYNFMKRVWEKLIFPLLQYNLHMRKVKSPLIVRGNSRLNGVDSFLLSSTLIVEGDLELSSVNLVIDVNLGKLRIAGKLKIGKDVNLDADSDCSKRIEIATYESVEGLFESVKSRCVLTISKNKMVLDC